MIFRRFIGGRFRPRTQGLEGAALGGAAPSVVEGRPASYKTAAYRQWRVDVVLMTQLGPLVVKADVAAPTVEQAIAVLDAEDEETLQSVACEWLPSETHEIVEGLSPEALSKLLAAAIGQTAMLPPVAHEPDADEPNADEPPDWSRTVLEVAKAYGWTVPETRSLPWPDFVAAARALPSLRARDTLQAVEASLAPHMDADARTALFDRLLAEASGQPKSETRVAPPWEQAGMTETDYAEQQRRLARAAVEAMNQLRRDAAAAAAE